MKNSSLHMPKISWCTRRVLNGAWKPASPSFCHCRQRRKPFFLSVFFFFFLISVS
ncbi:hypothetical protein LDENG_00047570 [Lucifuga dentata]|nr:hypothetical protein LDENG_00047570 [Lucifuga dentata]